MPRAPFLALVAFAGCGPAAKPAPLAARAVAPPPASTPIASPPPPPPPRPYHPPGLDTAFARGGVAVGPRTGGEAKLSAVVARRGAIFGAGYGENEDGLAGMMAARWLDDGTPDASFGGHGTALADFGTMSFAKAMVVEDDGAVVLAGYGGKYGDDDFLLARFDARGVLDPTFGDGGKVQKDFGGRGESPTEMWSDGGGAVSVVGCCDGEQRTLLVRYRRDGSVASVARTRIAPARFQTRAARAPDGSIVLAGYGARDPKVRDDYDLVVSRLRPDGALDAAFGDRGVVTIDLGGSEIAWALALAPDGGILVGGARSPRGHASPSDLAIVRLDARGRFDPSFGDGGKVVTDLAHGDEELYALEVLGDGRVVGAGMRSNEDLSGNLPLIVAYTKAGELDTRLEGRGWTTVAFGQPGEGGAENATLDGEGRLVLAAYLAREENDIRTVLVRFWP